MSSPFPGMNPYLEHPNSWMSFHNNLASEIQARLNKQLGNNYIARTMPYATYETIEITKHEVTGFYPDVAIWQTPEPAGHMLATAVETFTPTLVESTIAFEIPLQIYHVEVRSVKSKEVVTFIEILSPVNKRPSHKAYQDYERKRKNILRSHIHLIELDLLRGGTRPQLNTAVPVAPYYAMLSRAYRRPFVSVWPIQLADPLPVLPVPLLEPDPDVPLNLGEAVQTVYEEGAYDREIDYSQSPPPPALTESETIWLDNLLCQAKRR